MGQYNPFANTLLGCEDAIASYREVQLDSPTKQVAMRFQGAVLTPATLSLYLPKVVGNPGLALEIVTDLDPIVSSTIYVPTSDDVFPVTWVDQGAAVATFADVDARYNSAEYVKNLAAIASTGSLTFTNRGSAAYAALANTRIVGVRVGAVVELGNLPTNGQQVTVESSLRVGSATVTYPGPRRSVARITQGQAVSLTATLAQPTFIPDLGVYFFDPSTGLPWTMAAINLLIAATANYGWGITVRGTIAAGGFAVSGTWIEVLTCPENRLGGFFTSVTAPQQGWTRYTLGSTAALAANTWYWLTVSCPLATQAAYARLPVVRAQRVNTPTVATGTGEHRLLAEVALSIPGGVPYTLSTTPTNADGDTPAVTRYPGEMFPILLEIVGPAVQTQSQAYAFVDLLTIDSSTVATLYGQQATAGANQAYGGVQLPVILSAPNVTPDRPLVIEVRSGAGAITGGGALNATATIDPANAKRFTKLYDLTASPLPATHGACIIAPFDDGPFNAISGTQYFLIVKSAASPAKGWRMPRLDSRSDNLGGTAPTVANIEGATQGGQTDSYFASGAAADRYDLPIVLVASPTAPVGTANPFPAIAGDVDFVTSGLTELAPDAYPPVVSISWPATSLTTSFAGYRVYRRRRGMPARPWVLVADYTIPTGYTATTVEAQHTRFIDYEAGWSYPQAVGEEGWDYAFTVRHLNGMESFIGETTDLDNDVTDPAHAWLVYNSAPWLNSPLRVLTSRSVEADDNRTVYEVAGRDHAVVRTFDRIPTSRLRLGWSRLGHLSDEIGRRARTASLSGRQGALLDVQGQRSFGVLGPLRFGLGTDRADVQTDLVVTGTDSVATDYNLAAEVAFDGVNDYSITADNNLLDPLAQTFTYFMCARFTDVAGAYYLSKGNGTAANGFYLLRSAASSMQAFVRGATAGGSATEVNAAWFDGYPHVACVTYDGATLRLYRDGTPANSAALVAGSISNALGLVAGANNGGASGFTTSATRAWGLHVGKVYSADEAKAASWYLLDRVGYAIPPGATCLFDLADDRCWDGVGTTLVDLAGSNLVSALTGAPATRGRPWPLRDLDRW